MARRRKANPKDVYDSQGKLVGRFRTKTARLVARVVGGTIGKRRNPGSRFEYGAIVHGNAALSKAGFKTLQAARRYLRGLYSRGLLYGRTTEIRKIDNHYMSSERVDYKAFNPGRTEVFPTKEAAVAYARTHRKKGQKVFLQRVNRR